MASSYSPNWALIIVFRLKPDRRLITDSATTTAPGVALQADAPLDPPTTKTTLLHQMRP